MTAAPAPKKPLALDNNEEYTVSVDSLIEANHHHQFKVPYWQIYHVLGERFVEIFPNQGIEGIPDDDDDGLIRQMIAAWKEYEGGDYGAALVRQAALFVKRRLRAYRCVKQDKQVEGSLVLYGRGQHHLTINGQPWDYDSLDGNHRLMACHFCGVDSVPIKLQTKR